MASIAHSDWMFEHSLVHHFDTPVDFHPDASADLSHVTQTDSVASVLQTLWHHTDLMNGGSSSAQSASNASAAVGSGKGIPPALTVANTAITVNAGGSIALPITASPGNGHDNSVTISGLTSYESVTDTLDHKIFTGDSITLSAAEANSGLSLASNYTGTGHPVNTLTVTASDTFGHHTLTSAPQTIVVTDPPVSTSSSGGATTNGLTLQVSGDNLKGTDPQIEVFVDGTQIGGTYTITADHASGQTQTLQIAGNFDPTVAHQVQVKFINDAWDGQSGDGNDINAYVESISLNGTSIAGAQGTNNATNGAVAPANANEAVMDIDGTLTFSVPVAPPAAAPAASTSTTTNGLTLVVSGDNLHGTDPQIEVFVDGTQIGSTYTITADHSSGQTQTLQIAGNFDPTVAHQVQVKLINDAWDGQSGDGNDINAYVESISLNGTSIAGAQGTNDATNGAVPGANANEAVMDVDGTLTFSVPVAPPAPATSTSGSGSLSSGSGTSSGSSGLTLQVSGDNLHGTDPQIEVFVDGTQIGGTYTITADHASGQTQTLQIAGNFNPTVAHQIQVKLINDAWDGQSGDGNDINAYVESISLNGTSIAGTQGTNNATNGAVHGANANEAVMDIDGTLTFSMPAVPPPPNTLTLVVTGDNLHGTDPQIEVFVDGTQIGSTYTITADHASGQTQTLQIAGNFDPTVAHQVQVKFVNDAWDGKTGDGNDINAYVESISLNGTSIAGAQGTNTAANGAVNAANPNEAVMDVDGTLTFNVPAESSASASGTSSAAGSGGTATVASTTPTASIGAGAVPSGTGFFVAPDGNDSNAGTLASPFATLARAQQAMENSSIKTTYVEAGTYNITSTINITGADNGETWAYNPSDGVNSAVLDGGNTVDLFSINGASNITIDGLKMQHVFDDAISVGGALSNNITIENCDVGFNQHTSLAGGFNPMIGLGNVTNAHVLNNYVHDTASQGIALYAFNAGDTIDGAVVSGNVVVRAVQQMNDGGAIYVDMRNTNVNGGHVTISNNFVEDFGASGVQAEGIYLDDDSSNVTVSGNVIGPMNPAAAGTASKATIINGGCNNTFSDNIIDLGTTGTEFITSFSAPGGGGSLPFNWTGANVFQDNVIIANYAGGTNTGNPWGLGNNEEYVQGTTYPAQFATIQDNVYQNYGGGSISTQGNIVSDANPVLVDPQISGPAYAVASGSPVFGGTVNFTSIVGGWGPPGFVIPNDGIAPSDPA